METDNRDQSLMDATLSEHAAAKRCFAPAAGILPGRGAAGNGRIGRLRRTLIMRRRRSVLAFLPVETVIRDRQETCSSALAESDHRADSAPFIESLQEAAAADHVAGQASDRARQVVKALSGQETGRAALTAVFGLVHRPGFRAHCPDPALSGGRIERTQSRAPRSPAQRCRLTEKGRVRLRQHRENG